MSKASQPPLDIHDLSHDGRGVGRTVDSSGKTAGKACFVTGALPGEQVRWKLTNTRRSYDEGVCTEILQASSERVEPRCTYFSECGGCELQHLDASAQLAWKERQLRQTLSRAGLEPANWMPPLTGAVWNYRRRTRLAISYNRGVPQLGFRARGSHQLVEIHQCEVLDNRLNALLEQLHLTLGRLRTNSILSIELSAADSELAVCFNLKQPFDAQDQALLLNELVPVQIWQKMPQGAAQPLADYQSLRSQIVGNLQVEFTPSQFVQINPDLNSAMVQQALDWLQPQPDQRVLDLFCGSGNFSLALAQRCQWVVGAEVAHELCEQARQNAQLNGLDNLEFKTLDLSDSSQFGRLGKEPFDAVLLDPPREGAAALMPWLERSKARSILYVSCHPATMARDIQSLAKKYRIAQVGAMDMFPHTTHLEAMAFMLRK